MQRIVLKQYLCHLPPIISQMIVEYIPYDVITVSDTESIWCLYYDPEPIWKQIPSRFSYSVSGFIIGHHKYCIGDVVFHHNLITDKHSVIDAAVYYNDGYDIDANYIVCNQQFYRLGCIRNTPHHTRMGYIQQLDDNCFKFVCPMSLYFSFASAVLDNKIYISGGRSDEDGAAVSIVEVFDPDRRRCTKIGSLKQARFSHAMVAYRNRLYVTSGWYDLMCAYTGDTEMYDPASRRWVSADINFPFPIHTQYMVFDDVLYAYNRGNHIFSYYHQVYSWVSLPLPPVEWDLTYINETYIM